MPKQCVIVVHPNDRGPKGWCGWTTPAEAPVVPQKIVPDDTILFQYHGVNHLRLDGHIRVGEFVKLVPLESLVERR